VKSLHYLHFHPPTRLLLETEKTARRRFSSPCGISSLRRLGRATEKAAANW
jgi:hypothetical protein